MPIKKLIINMSLPIMVSMLVEALYNVVDSIFVAQISENAAGWIGKKALQRNAIIALGNSKDKDAIPYLKPLLKDIRPDIRKITIWALYNIDPETAAKLVSDIRDSERDKDVLEIIDEYLNGKLSDS